MKHSMATAIFEKLGAPADRLEQQQAVQGDFSNGDQVHGI
jgi:hypothetical protein